LETTVLISSIERTSISSILVAERVVVVGGQRDRAALVELLELEGTGATYPRFQYGMARNACLSVSKVFCSRWRGSGERTPDANALSAPTYTGSNSA